MVRKAAGPSSIGETCPRECIEIAAPRTTANNEMRIVVPVRDYPAFVSLGAPEQFDSRAARTHRSRYSSY